MTEDLEGRLDLDELEDPVVHDPTPEPDFYSENSLVFPVDPLPPLPPPPKASLSVAFTDNEELRLEGVVSALSFGPDGWLCTLSIEGHDVAPRIVLKAAKVEVTHVRVSLADGEFDMHTNVDCTVSFAYGSTSFTATSDEARYV